ncbi:MAG TPA: hypothetical protein VFK06_18820, partial [Candidatus Angelobacter sp.]|nr:hypothetical protein [Candidatus Angelobacter sp.]
MTRKTLPLIAIAAAMMLMAATALAQTDPGVQAASRGAGQPLASVTANNPVGILDFFNDGLDRFQNVEAV